MDTVEIFECFNLNDEYLYIHDTISMLDYFAGLYVSYFRRYLPSKLFGKLKESTNIFPFFC